MQSKLDAVFQKWARSLLGADVWRNGAVALSEVGWALGGFSKCVRSVALRRAKMLMLPADDPYACVFNLTATQSAGWAHSSKLFLATWGVGDWDPHRFTSYEAYKAYVDDCLLASFTAHWQATAARHSAQVPYSAFQQSFSTAIAKVWQLELSWKVQLCVRSWCRMRAGLLVLRHLNDKVSDARTQRCIFCGGQARNGPVHVLGVCKAWASQRKKFRATANLEAGFSAHTYTLAVLGCDPDMPAFADAVSLTNAIDRAAHDFWKTVTQRHALYCPVMVYTSPPPSSGQLLCLSKSFSREHVTDERKNLPWL